MGLYVNFALFNALVENGPDNRPVPELCESWEASNGARTWVLNLRRGVHFHNGKEFVAEDAIYSLNLHRGATKSGASSSMTAVQDIRKSDTHQITVTLGAGNADFPVVLTDFHLMMVPEGFSDWAQPIGTGAFAMEQFDPGVRVQLRKAGAYWKPDRGMLDAVDITVIADVTARTEALVSGQVDAINRVDPRRAARLGATPDIQVVRAAGGWFPVMAMMVDKAPYSNPDLRRALKCALDRNRIITTLFAGFGTLGNDTPIPRSDPYFNSETPQLTFDADKARFYFRKAGVTGSDIVLQASDAAFNGAVDMATLLQASASRCSIPFQVRREPADGYFDRVWLKGPFVVSYWQGRPVVTQMLEVAYQSTAPWNESHWVNAHFDALLASAKSETDEAKRKSAIWEMQAMLTEDGGTLIPCFRDFLDAHRGKVQGLTPHSGVDMDNGRVAEKAWLRG